MITRPPAKHPDIDYLSGVHWEQSLVIADLCTPPDNALMVGVGNAHGTSLAALLHLNSTWRGIQLEHEPDITDTWAAIQECGVGNRCQVQLANTTTDPPVGAYLYLLADLSRSEHWTHETLKVFLAGIRGGIPPGGWLLAIDNMPPETPPDDHACACPPKLEDCLDTCNKFRWPRPPECGMEWSLSGYMHLLGTTGLQVRVVRGMSHSFTLLGLTRPE
ncbi:hypothetical protein [Sinosporangium siamense]|uniref:Uncharacterized protein n=1 Tax=Sinosporangium siamense TaxID=1367973 RepID=A0A919VBC4_9ACTN|nr:hypothetical protein [Sinosporangium siamense]GII96362.1 hypothetical protein Ssi02_65930 [Sinosporangium siamense]